MYPSAEFNQAVRQKIIELGGKDPGDSFKIGHISLTGEDELFIESFTAKDQTEYVQKYNEMSRKAEADLELITQLAEGMIDIEKEREIHGDDPDWGKPPKSGPQIDVREFVKQFNIKES